MPAVGVAVAAVVVALVVSVAAVPVAALLQPFATRAVSAKDTLSMPLQMYKDRLTVVSSLSASPVALSSVEARIAVPPVAVAQLSLPVAVVQLALPVAVVQLGPPVAAAQLAVSPAVAAGLAPLVGVKGYSNSRI